MRDWLIIHYYSKHEFQIDFELAISALMVSKELSL